MAKDAPAVLFETRVGACGEPARLAALAAAGPHCQLAALAHHKRGDHVRPAVGQEGQVSARFNRQLGAPAAVLVVGVTFVVEPGTRPRPVGVLEFGSSWAGSLDARDGHQGQGQDQQQ